MAALHHAHSRTKGGEFREDQVVSRGPRGPRVPRFL